MSLQRIAYVLHIFPKLSETFVAGELAELRRRGVAVRILSLLPPRDELQHDLVRRAGLTEITTYESRRFAEVLDEFQPQLIHAHFATEATAQARALAAQRRVPFTFTAHGYDIRRKPPPDFRERALAAHAVVTVSRANARHIGETFDVPREHIAVIPCGVDTEEFCPAPPANKPADDTRWVVCVARQVPVKNLALLLNAFAELHRRGVKFRGALIGDGPLHDELRAQRARLGLEEIVGMPGALAQAAVRHWWQRASVGVLSSESEGMPVCLMEAAACGVPVVAPAVGGIPELVGDGVTGLLTRPLDATSLADALERLLGDAALCAQFGAAARQHALERFSVRRQVDQLLELWSGSLKNGNVTCGAASDAPAQTEVLADMAVRAPARVVPVSDPFDAAADTALPTVAAALNAAQARTEFKHQLPKLSGANGRLKLRSIRVIRHKPGKRCVIEYEVTPVRAGVKAERVTVIGKIRARRSGNEGLRQQEQIWNAGFDADSADGISVPEPLGVISAFKMWCQRKVAGEVATRLLAGPEGVTAARRIAEAIHKLHRANLPADRAHGMADELRILHECFGKLAAAKPEWTGRIAKLQIGCARLGAQLPAPRVCGIHRDFYSAQVIIERATEGACRSGVNAALRGRLWLLDFDLFCLGDPGLDVGNFIGHVTEQALREHGDPDALRTVETALEERFVELSGEAVRASVRTYTTLTLARHVYLSTQFPERRHTTEALLALCEQRVG